MSSIEIILWPALGFLVVAALASLRQARGPAGRRRAAILGGLAAAVAAWLLLESRA